MAKILIVDDDPDVVEVTRMYLQKEGHDVAVAMCKEDGMVAVKTDHPDMLVLDVMMNDPDDGIAMAQDLRHSGFKKPILMMSSINKVTGLDYGRDNDVIPVDDFVEKPVKPSMFIEKVNSLLGQTQEN